MNKIESIGKLIGKPTEPAQEPCGPAPTPRPSEGTSLPPPALHPLVVFGASTGGPRALVEVLSALPKTFGAGIIIVQHVDSSFSRGLGQWLSEQTGRQVTLISEGRVPGPGEVLLAGTADHLIMSEHRRLNYSSEPRMNHCRPSVDVFFESLARNWPMPGVAVVLTGMGRDGAKGFCNFDGTAGGRSPRRPPRASPARCQGRRRDRCGRRDLATRTDRRCNHPAAAARACG